eukprot:4803555-Prymnesium_polylepis.1
MLAAARAEVARSSSGGGELAVAGRAGDVLTVAAVDEGTAAMACNVTELQGVTATLAQQLNSVNARTAAEREESRAELARLRGESARLALSAATAAGLAESAFIAEWEQQAAAGQLSPRKMAMVGAAAAGLKPGEALSVPTVAGGKTITLRREMDLHLSLDAAGRTTAYKRAMMLQRSAEGLAGGAEH